MNELLGLLKTVLGIIDGVRALAKFIEKSRQDAWFRESQDAFKKVADAKSEDERKAAFNSVVSLWSKL